MDRTTLFDKILNQLFLEENGFVSIDIWGEQNCGTNERDPVYGSITKELIEREWADEANYSINILRLNYEGRQIIDKFGSYSSFIEEENTKMSKIERSKKNRYRVSLIVSLIPITLSIIFWILNYQKKEVIEKQKIEIEKLIEKISHLEQKQTPIHTNHGK